MFMVFNDIIKHMLVPALIISGAFIFSILQIAGVLRLKSSKMNAGWLASVIIIAFLIYLLLLNSEVEYIKKLWLMYIFAVSLWLNTIKFSLGLIQKKEITAFNRFEHFMAGLMIFYGLQIMKFVNLFPITVQEKWFEGLFILLIVNMASVGIEILELIIDLALGKKYMIGPNVHDTNWDITMTFLGSLVGFILLTG